MHCTVSVKFLKCLRLVSRSRMLSCCVPQPPPSRSYFKWATYHHVKVTLFVLPCARTVPHRLFFSQICNSFSQQTSAGTHFLRPFLFEFNSSDPGIVSRSRFTGSVGEFLCLVSAQRMGHLEALFQNQEHQFPSDSEELDFYCCKVRGNIEKKFHSMIEGGELAIEEKNTEGCPSEWKALARLITGCQRLYAVRVSDVEITLSDAEILTHAVALESSCKSHIKSLIFSNNQIGLDPGCFETLVRMILMLDKLQNVSFVRNCIADSAIPAIVELVRQHKSLRCLSLCWNGISDILSFAQALSAVNCSSKVVEIDLRYVTSMCQF